MIIVESRFKYWIGILAAIFLGMIFIVAGISKVFTPVVDIEMPKVLVVLLLMAELIIGIFLVACVLVKFTASFSLPLIAGFISSNILAKVLGEEECLSCFGGLGKLSVNQALYIDGILVALVITILCFYPGRFFNKRPWYWGK